MLSSKFDNLNCEPTFRSLLIFEIENDNKFFVNALATWELVPKYHLVGYFPFFSIW
ncbi:Uncharacterised protein, partial [Metamycoplasma alkalescens]